MVNGHSNWYWRWGLEDHDMAHRISSIYDKQNAVFSDDLKNRGFSENGSFTGLLRQVKVDLNSHDLHLLQSYV